MLAWALNAAALQRCVAAAASGRAAAVAAEPLVSLALFRAPPALAAGAARPRRSSGAAAARRHFAAAAAADEQAVDAAADVGVGASAADGDAKPPLAPGLYLVGTPIGCLEDITLRAVRVLRDADRVLCEDTRRTLALLSHLGIRTPVESFHAHNERGKAAGVVRQLRAGAAIALVSDAGMPAVSDPGEGLVAAAAAAGVAVVPVPGPSAVLAALVASGLPTAEFLFGGFAAAKPAARRAQFARVADLEATLIFFASPHALLGVLEDAAASLGAGRRVCLARELTKLHEELFRGSIEEALREFGARAPRGEFTLVFEGRRAGDGGGAPAGADDDEVAAALARAVGAGHSPSEAAKLVAGELGLPRKRVYALAMALPARGGGGGGGGGGGWTRG